MLDVGVTRPDEGDGAGDDDVMLARACAFMTDMVCNNVCDAVAGGNARVRDDVSLSKLGVVLLDGRM